MANQQLTHELQLVRSLAIQEMNKYFDEPVNVFTCDGCDKVLICKFAFDTYNVNEDCLVYPHDQH